MQLIYFSGASNNTHRYVEKLDIPSTRIPLRKGDIFVSATEPYVLIVPTYGAGNGPGAVPKQVIKFLNDENNRSLLRGIIGAGNTNFGKGYCLAADIIAQKCNVPVLYRFEILGTPEDVIEVTNGLDQFWKQYS